MKRLTKKDTEGIIKQIKERSDRCLVEIKTLVGKQPERSVDLDDSNEGKERIYAAIYSDYEGTTMEYFITKISLLPDNTLQLTTDEGWCVDESAVCYEEAVWPHMLYLLYDYIGQKYI